MTLANLSLEALKSVISTANDNDCNILSKEVKKRRREIDEQKVRYILIYIDSDYTWRKPYTPHILFDDACCLRELPDKLHNVIDKYVESYDDDGYYHELLAYIATAPQFYLVNGEHADKLREINQLELNEELNQTCKFYFQKLGGQLFEEIHNSIGLEQLFDNFPWSCGVMCLLRYSKTLDKLLRNGLPWDD